MLGDRRGHHPPRRSRRVNGVRKRIEEPPFGWIKIIGGGRQRRYRGHQRNRAWFKTVTAVYDLLRITALETQPA
jgi:hypothetical protein